MANFRRFDMTLILAENQVLPCLITTIIGYIKGNAGGLVSGRIEGSSGRSTGVRIIRFQQTTAGVPRRTECSGLRGPGLPEHRAVMAHAALAGVEVPLLEPPHPEAAAARPAGSHLPHYRYSCNAKLELSEQALLSSFVVGVGSWSRWKRLLSCGKPLPSAAEVGGASAGHDPCGARVAVSVGVSAAVAPLAGEVSMTMKNLRPVYGSKALSYHG